MEDNLPTQNLVRQLDGTDLVHEEIHTNPNPNMPRRKISSKLLKILIVVFFLLVAGLIFGIFFVFLPARRLLSSVRSFQPIGDQIMVDLKNQDLGAVQGRMIQVRSQLDVVESDFQSFSWFRFLPVLKNYYSDGIHGLTAGKELLSAADIGIAAVTPYADILGLKGLSTTGDGAKTAEDRINFIINTLDKVAPQLEQIGTHLETAKTELAGVDTSRYPEQFQGQSVRPQLVKVIALVDQAAALTNDARPLLEKAPFILGMDSARKYLVIFQNDAELRPTGGFMTAYSIIQINKGKLSIIQSNDIYMLDEKFTEKIPAPLPITKYFPKVPYWYLRDQNLSPDFKASMDVFYPNYLKTKSPQVDGIIAVDTQVLVDLLKITGPIGVPGFGTYSAEEDKRCNCPQVFYELENFADAEGPVVWDSVSGQIVFAPRNYGDRKSFIGPMMQSILANVMAQPKSKMGDMFTTAMDLIAAKHVQFYFLDPQAQVAAESFNLSGRVRSADTDYLFVVDTNFAGAKTNAWVEYTADLDVEVASDGTSTNTLTLTYKNPQHYFEDAQTGLKLNGIFRDWLRVYVPQGSELIETKGFETGEGSGTDLDKMVFEGFFTLTPLNTKTITIKYKSGAKSGNPYRILIQKQGGAKDFFYNLTINGKDQPEIILDSDKQIVAAY